MPDLLIPDVSEFQTVDFTVFSGPIIVRAHNGRRSDYHWLQHAAGASSQPWWAAYQYLPANVGAAFAAQRFLETLGTFRPNVTILDLEEGAGDQQQRQHDWLTVMAGDPARDWTYSGDYFARAHGLTVDWIAAYQNRAPSTAHTLWQFTDAHDFPGIGICDGSVFLGTVDDLIALTSTAGNTPVADPTPDTEDTVRFHYAKPDNSPNVYLVSLAAPPRHVTLFRDAEYWAKAEGHTVFEDGDHDLGGDSNGDVRKGIILDAKGRELFGLPA